MSKNQNKQYKKGFFDCEKALDMACEMIDCHVGGCPLTMNDTKLEKCDSCKDTGRDHSKCWKEYFLKECEE